MRHCLLLVNVLLNLLLLILNVAVILPLMRQPHAHHVLHSTTHRKSVLLEPPSGAAVVCQNISALCSALPRAPELDAAPLFATLSDAAAAVHLDNAFSLVAVFRAAPRCHRADAALLPVLVERHGCTLATERCGGVQVALDAEQRVLVRVLDRQCRAALELRSFATACVHQWRHVTVTWSGSLLALYVDGQLDATLPFADRAGHFCRAGPAPPTLLGHSSVVLAPYRGRVAALQWLQHELAPDEVADAARRALAAPPVPLASLQRVDARLELAPWQHCYYWWHQDAFFGLDALPDPALLVSRATLCLSLPVAPSTGHSPVGPLTHADESLSELELCASVASAWRRDTNADDEAPPLFVSLDLRYCDGRWQYDNQLAFDWQRAPADVQVLDPAARSAALARATTQRRCRRVRVAGRLCSATLALVADAPALESVAAFRNVSLRLADRLSVHAPAPVVRDPHAACRQRLSFARNASASIDQQTDVSYTTQLSIDRMDRLRFVAERYNGPVSVAVYTINTSEALEAIANARKNDAVEKWVDFHLFHQCDKTELYPVNALRNFAIVNARTEFVFHSDVDFIPSQDTHQALKMHAKSILVDHSRSLVLIDRVLVVPAFELEPLLKFPRTKAQLLQLVRQKQARQIHVHRHKASHGAVNYRRWALSAQAYEIGYERYFEPYIVASRRLARYDETFEGYGNDKDQLHFELHARHTRYVVLPDVFVVHFHHAPTTWADNAQQPTLSRRWRTFAAFFASLQLPAGGDADDDE